MKVDEFLTDLQTKIDQDKRKTKLQKGSQLNLSEARLNGTITALRDALNMLNNSHN
jgi:hypothetical protein